MRNQILIICFIWFLLPGCTSTYLIRSNSEPIFLESSIPRKGQILLKNGKIYKGFNIQITQDSIFWNTIEKTKGYEQTIIFVQKVNYKFQLSDIKMVVYPKNKRGAIKGFAAGTIIGTSIGLILGLASGVEESNLFYIVIPV